jgi:hypothetical protein
MHEPLTTRRPLWQPLTLGILLVAAGLTIFLRLLPPEVRPWNLAPIGALFLFAGARVRNLWLLAIPFCTAVFLDLFFFFQKDWPMPLSSYLAYGAYLFLGMILLQRSEHPVRVGLTAILGTVSFFLITNTAFWLEMVFNPALHTGTPYFCEANLSGLLKCYAQAIEFTRGTLLGDLVFSGLFFGAFAWLSRTYFAEERVNLSLGSN